ncbi:MAG: hypothetical protein U0559_01520 [Anaerolineae bacterium]
MTRSLEAQHVALKQLATALIARKTPDGLGLLLPHVLDLSEKQALSASEGALLARLSQLRTPSSKATSIKPPKRDGGPY